IGGRGAGHVQPITGATVTTVAEGETIMESAREAALTLGLLHLQTSVAYRFRRLPRETWSQLIQDGSVGHLLVTAAQMGQPGGNAKWISIYFADVDVPAIGRSLLSSWRYAEVRALLRQHVQAILIASDGRISFKGVGFARGGIFERFRLVQGLNSYTFTDQDYDLVNTVRAEGAPNFSDVGLFFLHQRSFVPVAPWQFVFVSSNHTGSHVIYRTFTTTYQLPSKDFIAPDLAAYLASNGLTSSMVTTSSRQGLRGIAVTALLFLLTVAFATRHRWMVPHDHRRMRWVQYAFLGVFLALLGVVWPNQPSVTLLLSIWHAALHGQWAAIRTVIGDATVAALVMGFALVAAIVWGRGIFCGWVCPFGAIQEFFYRIGTRLHLNDGRTHWNPRRTGYLYDRRARWLKIAAFAVLLVLAAGSIANAERAAEIEPFKTIFFLRFMRPWYFDVYAGLWIAVALFRYRPFCRYLCPLGGALAVFSVRPLRPIPRYEFCSRCTICARTCEVKAIDEHGRINSKECLRCTVCEHNYRDDQVCPVRIRARQGQPLRLDLPNPVMAQRPPNRRNKQE
ncbi:MAG: 4Fe-4S binding protein, partial [Firmicutes bacterium]|nr:4Fe-4S binding protein [Bacillota bacterium]